MKGNFWKVLQPLPAILCLAPFHSFFSMSKIRNGMIILALVPWQSTRIPVVALVTSVWVNAKKPRLATMKIPLQQSVALRIVELRESLSTWKCEGSSKAWVIKPQSVVSLMDVEEDQRTDAGLVVKLSTESMAVIKDAFTTPGWWPDLHFEDDIAVQQACLFGRRRGRKRKTTQPAAKKMPKKSGKKGKKVNMEKKKKVKKVKVKLIKSKKPIPFKIQNFKRTQTGTKLIREVLDKARIAALTAFPDANPFDPESGLCTVAGEAKGIPWEKFLDAVPGYFDYRPGSIEQEVSRHIFKCNQKTNQVQPGSIIKMET